MNSPCWIDWDGKIRTVDETINTSDVYLSGTNAFCLVCGLGIVPGQTGCLSCQSEDTSLTRPNIPEGVAFIVSEGKFIMDIHGSTPAERGQLQHSVRQCDVVRALSGEGKRAANEQKRAGFFSENGYYDENTDVRSEY